jgi:hypothetical protein
MSHYTGWRTSLQAAVAIWQCRRSNSDGFSELSYDGLAGGGGYRFLNLFFDDHSTFVQQFTKKMSH